MDGTATIEPKDCGAVQGLEIGEISEPIALLDGGDRSSDLVYKRLRRTSTLVKDSQCGSCVPYS